MSRTRHPAREAASREIEPTVIEVDALEPNDELTPEERRRLVADALEKLAAMHAFRDIDDPVAWQREIRKDRPLPGRDP